jgi:hypothetical protein
MTGQAGARRLYSSGGTVSPAAVKVGGARVVVMGGGSLASPGKSSVPRLPHATAPEHSAFLACGSARIGQDRRSGSEA